VGKVPTRAHGLVAHAHAAPDAAQGDKLPPPTELRPEPLQAWADRQTLGRPVACDSGPDAVALVCGLVTAVLIRRNGGQESVELQALPATPAPELDAERLLGALWAALCFWRERGATLSATIAACAAIKDADDVGMAWLDEAASAGAPLSALELAAVLQDVSRSDGASLSFAQYLQRVRAAQAKRADGSTSVSLDINEFRGPMHELLQLCFAEAAAGAREAASAPVPVADVVRALRRWELRASLMSLLTMLFNADDVLFANPVEAGGGAAGPLETAWAGIKGATAAAGKATPVPIARLAGGSSPGSRDSLKSRCAAGASDHSAACCADAAAPCRAQLPPALGRAERAALAAADLAHGAAVQHRGERVPLTPAQPP
jgi:hypothetical protein